MFAFRVLDLFSGIGGFSLGLTRAGMETVAFCEIDKYCQKILNKHWPNVPIITDIHSLDKEMLIKMGVINSESFSTIDLVCGGFPCQPFSCAGKRRGTDDDRYLWPEMLRIISELKPRWVVGENVAGIVNMELDNVLFDLERQGYETQTFIIPACAVNAPHRRDRVWILAHSQRDGNWRKKPGIISPEEKIQGDSWQDDRPTWEPSGTSEIWSTGQDHDVAHTESFGREKRNYKDVFRQNAISWWGIEPNVGELVNGLSSGLAGYWSREPDVPRVASGISERVNKLKALGNAIVPQIAEILGRAIMIVDANRQFNL